MKIKVGVMFGGKTVEHEISIISAIQAMGYLNKDKYDVIPIYITKNNEFYVGENIGKIEAYTDIKKLLAESQRIIMVNEDGKTQLIKYPQKLFSKGVYDYIDIAFPIVHGTNVEDGTLQGYLKMFNIPYVGCDVLSSAVGMDKYVMKTVLKDNGIPVLDCKCYTGNQYDEDADAIVEEIESAIGYPVIVKPVNLGSSIGISKAENRSELYDSLDTAFHYATKVLVETAVQNLKEINCSVLGDYETAEASECEEPVSSDKILTFAEKYIGDGSAKGAKGGVKGGVKSSPSGSKGMATLKRKIPADITDAQRDEIRALAVKAFKVLGCNGVSRIDFMMNTETQQIWLNEINTIPGSLSFYLWEPLGVKYSELLDKMISYARKRERENDSITYTFDSNVLQGVRLGGGTKGAKGTKN
ncbi:MAG: D-alanine--D-alanine ligase [Clostridia bacterium]|nr:D-alanine--D-alanine ligase [Clostridia bacterium]